MLLLELVQLTALEVSLFPSRLVVTQVYVRFVLLPLLVLKTSNLAVIRTSTEPHHRLEGSDDGKVSHCQNRQPTPRRRNKTSQVDCQRSSEPFCIERQ